VYFVGKLSMGISSVSALFFELCLVPNRAFVAELSAMQRKEF